MAGDQADLRRSAARSAFVLFFGFLDGATGGVDGC
jgi:hypothetical protein